MNDYLEVSEVAEVLGITRQAVYRLIDRGTLGAVWKWGRRLVREDVVMQLLESERYQRMTRRAGNAEREG